MASTTQSTGLFRLPAEVRAVIWEYALVQDKPIRVLAEPRQPGISCACSQFRKETLPMFYHKNSFLVENLHYECNYEQRYQSPAFCTFPTCSSKRVRPSDWIEAIGYKYLKFITKIQIKASTSRWFSAFDLTLEQNVEEKTLRRSPGSYWMAWDGVVAKDFEDVGYWQGRDVDDPLRKLLHGMIDRLLEPGLSPRAIQEIAWSLSTDFGMGRLIPTLEGREKKHFRGLPTGEILALMNCPHSEVCGWVKYTDEHGGIPTNSKEMLYATVLYMRSKFRRLKGVA